MNPRLPLVDPATATGQPKELLEAVRAKLGRAPNLVKAMAGAPAVLKAYLAFSGALSETTTLDARLREQIALAVAEVNACGYCLSAHAAFGAKLGLGDEQIVDARRARAADPRSAAILRLAQRIVLERGLLKDADLRTAREAGVSDAAIAETVAVVALNIFTNYFNHVAGTPIDFPEVRPGVPQSVSQGAT